MVENFGLINSIDWFCSLISILVIRVDCMVLKLNNLLIYKLLLAIYCYCYLLTKVLIYLII